MRDLSTVLDSRGEAATAGGGGDDDDDDRLRRYLPIDRGVGGSLGKF